MTCPTEAALPWLPPCCADCAARARSPEAGDTSAPSSGSSGAIGTGALLVLGGIFVLVVWGERALSKLG